jgi:molybdate transport system regulatory protein
MPDLMIWHKESCHHSAKIQPCCTFAPKQISFNMNLRINGRIWLETASTDGTERFMGIGRLELLGHIQRTGSINQAAKAMNMSYKRAWELVHSMNTQADSPLVTTQTGGEKGGGTIITAEGEKYLSHYRSLHERFEKFLADELVNLPA